MFGIVFDSAQKKLGVRDDLKFKDIETRDFFYPIHKQPCFNHIKFKGEFPVSERLSECGLLLPSGYGLKESQQAMICEEIKNAI